MVNREDPFRPVAGPGTEGNKFPWRFQSYLATACFCMLTACEAPGSQARNVALGRPVEYSPAPNYPPNPYHPGPYDLTDGKTTLPGRMWTSRGSVVWAGNPPVFMSVDLGQEYPVDAIEITTAAGTSGGVVLSRLMEAYGSLDGKQWGRLGGLRLTGQPAGTVEYATYLYRLSPVNLNCRFVRIGVVVMSGGYVFCTDQLRVFAGETSARPVSASISDTKLDVQDCLRQTLKAARAAAWAKELQETAVKSGLGGAQVTWAALARSKGLTGVRLWKRYRFAALRMHDFPSPTEDPPRLSVNLFKGESRGDAILVTNAEDSDLIMHVSVEGLAAWPAYLGIAACPWTDPSGDGPEVAMALPYIEPQGAACEFTVASGTTTRVWIEVDGSAMTSGVRQLDLVFSHSGKLDARASLQVTVPNVALSKPKLSLSGWDFVDGLGNYYGVPQSESVDYWHLAHDGGVDTACGAYYRICRPPKPDQFVDDQVKGMDVSKIDEWVHLTSGVRQRMLYLQGTDSFAGAKMGTPQFELRLGSWIRAVADRIASLDPTSRLSVLVMDEPAYGAQAEIIDAWMAVIKQYAPSVRFFIDPNFRDFQPEPVQQALAASDIICLNLDNLKNPNLGPKYIQEAQGHDLWLYTGADVPKMDPTDFFRLFPWLAFACGANGIMYYSFSDNGYAESSWDLATAFRMDYSPLFLGGPIAASLHWEALREGMWDNELFQELAAAIKGSPEQAAGETLLDRVRLLAAQRAGKNPWDASADGERADAVREDATAMLESLRR